MKSECHCLSHSIEVLLWCFLSPDWTPNERYIVQYNDIISTINIVIMWKPVIKFDLQSPQPCQQRTSIPAGSLWPIEPSMKNWYKHWPWWHRACQGQKEDPASSSACPKWQRFAAGRSWMARRTHWSSCTVKSQPLSHSQMATLAVASDGRHSLKHVWLVSAHCDVNTCPLA